MARLHVEAFIRIASKCLSLGIFFILLIVGLPQVGRYRGRISYKPIEDKQLLRNTLIKANDIFKKLGREHFQPKSKIEMIDSTEELNNEGTIEAAFKNTQLAADKNGKVSYL